MAHGSQPRLTHVDAYDICTYLLYRHFNIDLPAAHQVARQQHVDLIEADKLGLRAGVDHLRGEPADLYTDRCQGNAPANSRSEKYERDLIGDLAHIDRTGSAAA